MDTIIEPKRTGGRPKADIDWEEAGRMLRAGCKGAAIAARFGVDPETLYNRCKTDNNVGFTEFLRQKLAEGNDLLHEKQYNVAMSGDKVMLVWLGKNRLGQSDKSEVTRYEGTDAMLTIVKDWYDRIVKAHELSGEALPGRDYIECEVKRLCEPNGVDVKLIMDKLGE